MEYWPSCSVIGSGGFSYLSEPMWWAGMATMIVEGANFAAYAYAFAPTVLVTPLGALSIIVSAVLAHFMLNEKLHICYVLGCTFCIVGSITIVMHVPTEKRYYFSKRSLASRYSTCIHWLCMPGSICGCFPDIPAVVMDAKVEIHLSNYERLSRLVKEHMDGQAGEPRQDEDEDHVEDK